MASSERTELIEAIRERLIPKLYQLGFTDVPLTRDEKGSEVGTSFPFGRLRRPTSTGYDLIEIQLDKHRPAAFRLNFAKVPASGIVHAVGPVKAEDVWVHYQDHFCELYASPTFRRWFSAAKLFGGKPGKQEIAAFVDRVAELIPQVESYFSSGGVGGNVRCV